MLIVLSGLPGTGKTTIARALARELSAVNLRIDSIEQALRCEGLRVEGEGYDVAYAVAEDNLRLGRTVIADCVNPWPLTRRHGTTSPKGRACPRSTSSSSARTRTNTGAVWKAGRPTSMATDYPPGRKWLNATTGRGRASGW